MNIATTTGLDIFHPEMGETRAADAVIDAKLSHYGKHWFLKTPLALKGRGIKFLETLTADKLTPAAQYRVGHHSYIVTEKAFEKLKTEYKVSIEQLLD